MSKIDSEEKLFRIAAAQGGYFTALQAKQAGFSDNNHSFHLRAGNWIREWRGIYRLARYPLQDDAQYALWGVWTSDRHGKRRGAYSHETALSLYGLSDLQPTKLHVTVPRGYRRHGSIPEILCLHHADVKVSGMRREKRLQRSFAPSGHLLIWSGRKPYLQNSSRQAVEQALDRGVSDPCTISHAKRDAAHWAQI